MAEAEGKLVESQPPLLMRAPLLSVAGALTVGVWAGWAVAMPMTVWLAIGFFLIAFGLAYTAKERAAGIEDIGIPKVSTPEVVEPEQLTPEPEGVDSDIPDA